MKVLHSVDRPALRSILLMACTIALVMTFLVAHPQPAFAGNGVTPPSVPADIQVPEGNIPFLVGHAVGTQNYVCLPSTTAPSGFAFTLFTPQANLFDDEGKQIITHFFSPNPDEDNRVRPAWQDSKDTSTFWGKVEPGDSIPDPNGSSIAWLLLTRAGKKDGPTGGDRLSKTTFIQRVNTTGGVAPAADCTKMEDVGRQAFVPYTADYFFYRAKGGN